MSNFVVTWIPVPPHSLMTFSEVHNLTRCHCCTQSFVYATPCRYCNGTGYLGVQSITRATDILVSATPVSKAMVLFNKLDYKERLRLSSKYCAQDSESVLQAFERLSSDALKSIVEEMEFDINAYMEASHGH